MRYICLLLFAVFSLQAMPRGGKAVAGKMEIENQGQRIVIKSGKKAIYSWDEFSIGKNEAVHFSQSDAKSAVLNRVRGRKGSEILGSLSSNGQVYLLNPNGILFGNDCQINVTSLVASTLDVLDCDFLRGDDLPFIGTSRKRIKNLGKIDLGEGEIFFLAREIDQWGELSAEVVGLGSGRDLLLRPKGEQRIFIQPDVGGNINCEGDICAAITEIRSGSPYVKAIRIQGKIENMARKEENGRIYLIADKGRVVVDGNIYEKSGQLITK